MPVVLIYDGHCYQFDNAPDAARFADLYPNAVELSAAEIAATFGVNARHVGPHNTTVAEDGTITFAPKISIDDLRAAKQSEIRDKADAILKAMASEYPDMEMATWDQQYQEALAYTADSAAATPLISAIAQGRSMAVADLAARIIANREAWVAISGAIVGQRLAYQDALDAATTTEDVEAIQVVYALD